MKLHRIALAILAATLSAQAGAATIAYMSGTSEPWGSNSNLNNMNTAFGNGNWDRIQFGAAFNAYDFLYVDGGNGQSSAFYGWVDSNRGALENYVTGGGRLFLNAGGWSTGAFSMLFGTTLTEERFSTTGTAVDPTHAIFDGAGTSWSGNWFSHSIVTGDGLTALITGSAGTILAEGTFGAGFYMLGGQTSSNFHSSIAGSNPTQLRVNELLYASSFSTAVPEPASLALLGIGLAGLGCLRRKA